MTPSHGVVMCARACVYVCVCLYVHYLTCGIQRDHGGCTNINEHRWNSSSLPDTLSVYYFLQKAW